MKSDREILVIGGNHHNTLSVLRSLGEKGMQSLLIIVSDDPTPYVGYSKFIKKCRVVKSVNDIAYAMEHLHSSTERAVVIACSDSISSYLDSNYNKLSRNYILPGSSEQGKITNLMNKNTMMQLAVECDIRVPKSWIVYPPNPNVENVTYPCIVKPLVSKNGSKADIVICNNRLELETFLKTHNQATFQIQEYIAKDIEFQLIGCSLNGGEKVIIPGASIILRQPKNTNTGFLRYIPIHDFSYEKDACIRFIRNTGYSGLFSLEFLRDKKSNDYFMEINFRNDGNSICVTASGMNLPYIWYLYNCGLSIEKEVCFDNMREVFVMPEFNDIGNALHGRISWIQWLRDVRRTDCFMEFCKHDQKPFWVYIYKKIFHE